MFKSTFLALSLLTGVALAQPPVPLGDSLPVDRPESAVVIGACQDDGIKLAAAVVSFKGGNQILIYGGEMHGLKDSDEVLAYAHTAKHYAQLMPAICGGGIHT